MASSHTAALDTSPQQSANQPRETASVRTAEGAMMKAVIATGYGATDVLELRDVNIPTPGPAELLIAVHATNVSAADSMMRRGDPAYARLFLGLRKPKRAVPGTGFAGVVQAVGTDVTQFAVGDAVFGEAGMGFGAHAEYVCVPEDGAVMNKPEALSFGDAAVMCDGPMTSLNFLQRMAKVQPGDRVLINGAAGSLGTAAVQLAKALGAEVTGVCRAANHELVTSLGADHVIDYTQEDFTRTGQTYDVIYDTVGKSSYGRSKRALAPGGKYMSPVLSMGLLLQMMRTSLFGSKKAMFDATGLRAPVEQRAFLDQLVEMMAEGKLRVVTERVYRLDDIAEAHAHVDGGHKRGNLIIQVVDEVVAAPGPADAAHP